MQRAGGLGGDGGEGDDRIPVDRVVQGVGRGHGADQDEHDEAHALLAVVGAMGEADASAGEDEQAADVERRRLGAFGGFVEARVFGEGLEQQKHQKSAEEADQWRDQQREEDLGDLLHVDARDS